MLTSFLAAQRGQVGTAHLFQEPSDILWGGTDLSRRPPEEPVASVGLQSEGIQRPAVILILLPRRTQKGKRALWSKESSFWFILTASGFHMGRVTHQPWS